MSASSPAATLVGRFLVAAPSMPDERFQKSVVFVCKHDDDGALGIIVNNKVDDLPLGQVYKQLGIDGPQAAALQPVLFGGPVETARGLVLHSADYKRDETMLIEGGLALTASLEILKDMAGGTGPKQAWLALGHSGWSPGQLDREMQDNAWLRGRCRPDAGVRSRPRCQMAARARPSRRQGRWPGQQVRSGVLFASGGTRLKSASGLQPEMADCAGQSPTSVTIGEVRLCKPSLGGGAAYPGRRCSSQPHRDQRRPALVLGMMGTRPRSRSGCPMLPPRRHARQDSCRRPQPGDCLQGRPAAGSRASGCRPFSSWS